MGASLINERRRQCFWTIISTTNYFRCGGTHAVQLTSPSNKLFKLYICAVNRQRMHFTRGRSEPIYTWRWRSRSYYRTVEKKTKEAAIGAGTASEIYGGAAPPGAVVSPNRARGFQETRCGRGLACTANIDYPLVVLLIGGRLTSPGGSSPALSALDPRELSTFAFPASISLIASSRTDLIVVDAVCIN